MTQWHIHIDAHEDMAPGLQALVAQMGFWKNDFLHEPDHISYEPKWHLTCQPKDATEFLKKFKQLEEYVEQHKGELIGYIEGECIPFDEDISHKPFNQSVPIPFRVTEKELLPGQFKQDEIHISLLRDQSDKRLHEALFAMGLYVGYLPHNNGVRAVYTVSGLRPQIYALLPKLIQYLQTAGGGVNCSVKEERIAQHWTSSPDVKLAPVIDRIEWL